MYVCISGRHDGIEFETTTEVSGQSVETRVVKFQIPGNINRNFTAPGTSMRQKDVKSQ
jgi:hypothetical protein